ncbi:MAG: beta-propeller domain-containing protein [Clostridiaceae bacterium]
MNKKIDKLKEEYQNIEVPPEIDFALEKGIKKGKRRKKTGREYMGLAAAVLICIMSLSVFKLRESSLSNKAYEKEPAGISLSLLGSSDNLLKILKDNQNVYNTGVRGGAMYGTEDAATKSASNKEYSNTNNQVEGVDEEDIVQTDGKFIYTIDEADGNIDIVRAYPTSKMELVSKIKLDKSFKPSGIFLYNDYLVAAGNVYPTLSEQNAKSNYSMKFISSKTQLVIYDISDKKNVKKVRDLKVEGGYVTSRITNNKLFIVSNKYLSREIIIDDKKNGEVRIEDSAANGEIVNSYDKIKYVSGIESGSYLNITRVDLENMNSISKTDTILGFSGNVYCSLDNLYLTGVSLKNNKAETLIYKYSLKYNKFIAKGSVEGTVLNQFSMDENNGYFRIATTTGDYYGIGGVSNDGHNNLYILDKDLKISGSLNNLAKDERIYSVRFMGDRGYIVTYKEMDPLFVIDLKNPANPKVLGELKIPGFSNYLHPYDENHLIGLGMDSVLVTEGGEKRARPTGLKISLFDVTDVSKPKELYKVNIGGEGSGSEALYNHKAFMFSKEKNILSIPVDIRNGYTDSNGKQGAAVFSINLNGIKEKGIISQSDGMDKNSELYNLSAVKRTLYIDDVLYTLSNEKITANDINSLDKINEVKLK